jgi:hypothetical protein
MPISNPREGDLTDLPPVLVPLRTIRRVLCNALRDMTHVFMQTYQQDSAVKASTSSNGATAAERFAYTETVATSVAKLVAAGSVLDEDCYPLACKLLLDTGTDFNTCRQFSFIYTMRKPLCSCFGDLA